VAKYRIGVMASRKRGIDKAASMAAGISGGVA